MQSTFYVARNDAADSWQLFSRHGSPCMARGTLEATLATAKKLEAVKCNRLEWPLPVFRAADDDTPAAWDGQLTSGGEWV